MAQHIIFAQLPAKAWKNGGGSTTEVAVSPPGAGFDSFDWRISVATVGADGPFSVFPGIDRTLTLLSGAGMALEVTPDAAPDAAPEAAPEAAQEAASGQGAGQLVTLCPQQPAWVFAGEWPIFARLLDGVTIDFNVMSRRSRYRHQVVRHVLDGGGEVLIRRQTGCSLIFVAALDDNGLCELSDFAREPGHSGPVNTSAFGLRRHDCLLLDSGDGMQWRAHANGSVTLLQIELIELIELTELTELIQLPET